MGFFAELVTQDTGSDQHRKFESLINIGRSGPKQILLVDNPQRGA